MNWRDKFNRKYAQISLYVIITCVIIYCLSLIADNAPLLARKFMNGIGWILRVIKPVILGYVFAYLMDPVVSLFERKIRKTKILKKIKRPRTISAVLSVALLFIAIVGLITMLVYSVTRQLRLANFDDIIRLGEEFLDSFEGFYNSIKSKLGNLEIRSEELEEYVKDATEYIMSSLLNFVKGTVNSLTNISSYLTTIIFSFIIGFYFMIDGRMFMEYVRRVWKALFPESFNKKTVSVIRDLDQVFSGYIRGQLTDAFVMMILISLTLSITGVNFAIVIGILAGIGNLIPYFGPIIAYIGTTVVCLINGETRVLFVSILALAVIQFIDGNMIGPKLLSRSIKIHPLVIIISLIFGSAIGGFLGMLLAVPVGAYVKLVFVRFIDNRMAKKEGANPGLQTENDKADSL